MANTAFGIPVLYSPAAGHRLTIDDSIDSIRSFGAEAKAGAELTLRGLKVFVAVEETRSIGGAAERIGSSPSSVSQQITALEAAVGAKLFDRRGRPITLTPAGQVLRRHAHKIMESVSEAQTELAELNLTALPKLSLSIIDDFDISLTPALVSRLQAQFKNCFVSASTGRSDMMVQELVNRKSDIALASLLPDDPSAYWVTPILRETFFLVSAKGAIDPDEDLLTQLSDLPFVQFSEDTHIGRLIAQHMRRVRFNTSRRFAFEAARSVFATVVQSGGWTIANPLSLLDAERFTPHVDLQPLPFPALSRRIWLIARADELGRLPERLAMDCRRMVKRQALGRFQEIAPNLAGLIEILDE